MFTNDPGDPSSFSSRVIPKTQKWYLIRPCITLSIIRYVSRVKWSNPRKGVALSPTPRCSSYWKWNFRVALDYGRQLYLFKINVLILYKSAFKIGECAFLYFGVMGIICFFPLVFIFWLKDFKFKWRCQHSNFTNIWSIKNTGKRN